MLSDSGSPGPGQSTPAGDGCSGGCGRKRRRGDDDCGEEEGGSESERSDVSSTKDGEAGDHSRSDEDAASAASGGGPPRPPSTSAATTDTPSGGGGLDDEGGPSPSRRSSPRLSVANKKPRLENENGRHNGGTRTPSNVEEKKTTATGKAETTSGVVTFSSDLTTTHQTYSASEYDRTPAPPPDDLYDCDVCGLTILPGGEFGRYTCTECDDYDICSMCYEGATTTIAATKGGGGGGGGFGWGWDHEHDAERFEYVPPVDEDEEEREEEEGDEDGETLTRTGGASSSTTTRELKGGEAEV